jgi:hypothetical protein
MNEYGRKDQPAGIFTPLMMHVILSAHPARPTRHVWGWPAWSHRSPLRWGRFTAGRSIIIGLGAFAFWRLAANMAAQLITAIRRYKPTAHLTR